MFNSTHTNSSITLQAEDVQRAIDMLKTQHDHHLRWSMKSMYGFKMINQPPVIVYDASA